MISIKSILVPTDFSEDADRVLDSAITVLSEGDDARLVLLHAYHLPFEYTAYGTIPTSLESFAEVVSSRRGQYTGADQVPVPIDSQQFERQLACPRCSGRMESHPYHGPGNVAIDTCSKCHLIWLDHGELASIERAPGLRRPRTASYDPPSPTACEQEPEEKSIDLFSLFFR